jgi:hypothetical protein
VSSSPLLINERPYSKNETAMTRPELHTVKYHLPLTPLRSTNLRIAATSPNYSRRPYRFEARAGNTKPYGLRVRISSG